MKLKIKNKLPLIRTLAALLVLITVMGVVTYSWTMGIEDLSIDSGLKTAPLPSAVNNTITLDATETGQVIDLSEFDQLSHDGMYFSEVKSDDGINFEVPNGNGTFRDANTNDIGEKFIKFDFAVNVTYKCSLRFAAVPTISILDSNGNSVADADTSAFRIMIGDGTTSKIFTTGTASGNLNNLTTFGTATDILSFEEGDTRTLKVSVWLDGRYTALDDNLAGNKVKLNLKLKAHSDTKKTTIYFEERSGYSSLYYTWIYNSSNSSTVYTDNKSWPGDQATYNSTNACYEYSFNTTDTGNFNVFVSDNGDTTTQYPLNGDTENYLQGTIGGTYLFTADNRLVEVQSHQHIASVRVGSGSGTVGLYNYTSNSIVGSHGTSKQIIWTPADGYELEGFYTDKECTEVYESNSKGKYFITIYDSDITLYAKFVEVPKCNLTFKAVTYNSAGALYQGTGAGYIVWYDDAGAIAGGGYTHAETLSMNEEFTVKAYFTGYDNNPDDSPYRFVGWYADEDCTNLLSTDREFTITATGNEDYYAKFVEKILYFKPTSAWAEDNARFAAYVWEDGSDGTFYSMSDSDGDGIYSAAINTDKYNNVIFTRMNPSNQTNSFDKNQAFWNKTGDLVIPSGKNYYTKTGSDWDLCTTGTWGTID